MGTDVAVNVGTRERAQSVTGLLVQFRDSMNYALKIGYEFGRYGAYHSLGEWYRSQCPDVIATVRSDHGFVARYAPILTSPDAQHKLAMGKVPSSWDIHDVMALSTVEMLAMFVSDDGQ